MFFNSKECEWVDLELFVDGFRVAKFLGVKYKKAQEKEFLYAAGSEPIGIQKGNKAYTGEARFLKGALDDMNRAARVAGADDITDISYTLVINYKARGNRAIQTDTLVGVEFEEYEKGMEQNAKSMEITLPFKFLGLKQV